MKVHELFESTEDDGHSTEIVSMDTLREWAAIYRKHCDEWQDVEKPLWRIDRGVGQMQTTTRKYPSKGSSGEIWAWMYDQPEWAGFPDRRESIFCSTTRNIEFAHLEDDGVVRKMIYPFNGTKMAQCKKDFNSHKVSVPSAPGISSKQHSLSSIQGWLMNYRQDSPAFKTMQDAIDAAREDLKNGKEISTEERAMIKTCLKAVDTGQFTPKEFQINLVTPDTIKLPVGQSTIRQTQEVWFSGKYLSIPEYQGKDFFEFVYESIPTREAL